jgi:phage/conjugal plasmid C-4 type zinc finger TraR family protein
MDQHISRDEIRDDADRAAWLEEQQRERALAARYETPHDPQDRDPNTGEVICFDCRGPIPPERLAASPHAVRCIDCQREEDRLEAQLQRLYGGNR